MTFIYRQLQGNPDQQRFTVRSGILTCNGTGGTAQVAAAHCPNERTLDLAVSAARQTQLCPSQPHYGLHPAMFHKLGRTDVSSSCINGTIMVIFVSHWHSHIHVFCECEMHHIVIFNRIIDSICAMTKLANRQFSSLCYMLKLYFIN